MSFGAPGPGRKWSLHAPLLFCSCLANSTEHGSQGAPFLSASCITQWALAKAKGFARSHFSKCLLLLVFFIVSRVRAEGQESGTDGNHRALGQTEGMDKDVQCLGLWSDWLQGCSPQVACSSSVSWNPRPPHPPLLLQMSL